MKLAKEVGIFADLHEDFYRVCVSDQRKKGHKTSSTRRLIQWIEDAREALRVLLDRVQALAGDSKYSMLETLTAHVKWFFNENDVKCLRSSLSVAQEGMRGFSNITVIKTIKEGIRTINAVTASRDRQAIQALEERLGATLEERVDELKQTRLVLPNWVRRSSKLIFESENRRRQRRAINARMQEASEVLQEQRTRIGASAIVPESEQNFDFARAVKRYSKEARKQHRSEIVLNAHPREQSARADSIQPTNSTISSSFTSKHSSYSPPIRIASPATSNKDFGKTLNYRGTCTSDGVCAEVDSHPVNLTRPSPPDSAPLPRSNVFQNPSYRFDRSWQLLQRDFTACQSTKSTLPMPDDHPCESWQTPKEPAKPDPELGRTMEGTEDLPSGIGADRLNNMSPSQQPDDEEFEIDDAEEEYEVSEEEAQPSPFQPVAGVQGRFPRNWRNRHERSELPDDHWHRRL